MVDKKETKETIKNWLDDHDINEIIATDNLDIVDNYNSVIPFDDLMTIRDITIKSMPYMKHIKPKKEGKQEYDGNFIDITDNGKEYQLPFDSKALQRSFITTVKALCEKKLKHRITDQKDLDVSIILDKTVSIKRELVRKDGYKDQFPYKLFLKK